VQRYESGIPESRLMGSRALLRMTRRFLGRLGHLMSGKTYN